MNKKIKIALSITLLFIAVGYASLFTSLDLEGLLSMGFDGEDFKVQIIRTNLDGTDVSETISEDKRSFTFQANASSRELLYKVKNVSTKYDAVVSLTCTTTGNATFTIHQIGNLSAMTIGKQTIDISEAADETVTCTLGIDAVEKNENVSECCKNAKNIAFQPDDPNWKVSTVEEALNYLRENR